MADITLSKKNESYLNIDAEMGIMYELSSHFEFYVEGYKFQPKYKLGVWDGKIRLLDLRFGTLPLGLYAEVVEVAGKLGYTVETKSSPYGSPDDKDDVTLEELERWIISLNISSKNKEIEVRKYQIETIFNCIKNNRQIAVSPTGSGKSVIAYCLYRWYLERGEKHTMLVVPNLGLIKQMYADFCDYSGLNGFDVESNTQVIAEGASKTLSKSLILGTWQSVYKMPSSWWKDVDVIIGDEAHQFKAEACRNIFERATETKYKFGMTGSLDKSTVNKLTLRGLIGDISKVKTTRDLIDEGYLSEIKIKCIILKYNAETKKIASSKTFDYPKEIEYLNLHEGRNNFISNLALKLSGNTLILFNHINHGEELHALISAGAVRQKVHFISGKIEADDRERIRNLVQNSNEPNIVLGSVGTTSTGINIPRLHNIIFASPSKSVIRVMQSIGRGLRVAFDKDHLVLYDISDDLSSSTSKPNFTMRHFIERLKLYVDESHPYTITEIKIEK